MRLLFSLPAVIALGICLSGCTVYHVAATTVDATTTVVGVGIDVGAALITAPFGHGSDKPEDK